MKKVSFALLGLAIVVLLFIWYKYNVSYAQESCCNPPLIVPRTGWSGGNYVTVTISSAFTEPERQAIKDAFKAWNDNYILKVHM